MRYFEIGTIVNTQGIHGDVRVVPSTFDVERFKLLKEVFVEYKNDKRTLVIDKVWYHKNLVILKFCGVDDMNAAERLKNYVLKIDESQALPLGEDEYYVGDLYYMRVVTDDGEELGKIVNIIETGANDVYCVRMERGETGEFAEEILIPAIKQCVLKVDVPNKVMTVKLMEGLR